MDDKASKTNAGRTRRAGLPRSAVEVLIGIAAVAALAIVGFGINKREQETAATEPPPVNVTVMTVTAEPNLPDAFDLPAVVEPNRVVTVSAEVAGRVEWIGPKEGTLVRAGDRLVQLNADLLQTEFERVQAQTKYDQTEFERQKGLVEGGAAPSRALDEATTKLAVSKAQLEEVRARLARTRIVAPISGVLNDLPVEIGEYVQTGTAVADIVDTATVKVAVEVPERDISFFSEGQDAEVLADVKGRQISVKGKITFISELADSRTRSTRMEIMLPNEDGRLRSGQIVQARLTRQVLKDVIMIPLLAVIPLEEGKSVYVVESSTAERREVELGVIKGDRVRIKSGLQPGDRLIVAGHRFVAPGQNVNVVSEGK